jgi:hypothetical protein
VNFLLQGQPLFVALDAPSPVSNQSIEFRDFSVDASYMASLVSKVEGSGTNLTSSFHIELEKTGRDGTRKTYTVGTPAFRRPQIVSYRILKVITAPVGGSMIMVIEMKRQSGTDYDIRYMVESLYP